MTSSHAKFDRYLNSQFGAERAPLSYWYIRSYHIYVPPVRKQEPRDCQKEVVTDCSCSIQMKKILNINFLFCWWFNFSVNIYLYLLNSCNSSAIQTYISPSSPVNEIYYKMLLCKWYWSRNLVFLQKKKSKPPATKMEFQIP